MLHEEGYTFLTIPKLHSAEVRRIIEGKRIAGDLRQAERSDTGDSKKSLKESAKENAVAEYKRKKGLT